MRIAVFYGTRPELIKLYPLIKELKTQKLNPIIVNVGQHKEILEELESEFSIHPDHKLEIMKTNQTLKDILVNVANAVEPLLKTIKPDLVLVQGDTSTVSTVAMLCFYNNIKIGHIEAGLRSFDLRHPFPEEFNRKLVSLISSYNFVPTENSKENLIKEGVDSETIYITGNTIVDTVNLMKSNNNQKPVDRKNKILITAHRRENHGLGITEICNAVITISEEFPAIEFIWPLHPNPNVRKSVNEKISSLKNVRLCEPLNYSQISRELSECILVWTDSGGIQEECPAYKKPVLILRNVTERPEVITSGFGILTGTDVNNICRETRKLLKDASIYNNMISGVNPFGDGMASHRIVEIIKTNYENIDNKQ